MRIFTMLMLFGLLSFHIKAQDFNTSEETQTQAEEVRDNEKIDGYRGIWWSIRPVQKRPHVPNYGSQDYKYSGPLSFAWPHTLAPMAIHAPEVNKTFFVYGGDTGPEDGYLLTMISYYDHEKHRVPKPTVVRDQRGVDDPHDNPSLTIDDKGYIWVFIAGRSRHRPGQIFRSNEPYSIESFEKIVSREQTYSQIWYVPNEGFMHLLTLYTSGRELYWETNSDGRNWVSEPAEDLNKLVGFGGHYQVSRIFENTVGTVFNYHPEGLPDRRTNLYYIQTSDFGKTWTTVDGTPIETPLIDRNNPALVTDYEAKGKVAFPNKLLFDNDGHPVILYITAFGVAPVHENAPRVWKIVRWTGDEWITRNVTVSDHIYDLGTFFIHEDRWTMIGPALPGPQAGFTGGEVGIFETTEPDQDWWQLKRRVTMDSSFNHGYMRRPHNPVDPFYAIWADGNSKENSISRLYFTNSKGDRLFKLPYKMDEDYAEPIELNPPIPPEGENTSIYKQ